MLAVMPVKSGLRSYGGLLSTVGRVAMVRHVLCDQSTIRRLFQPVAMPHVDHVVKGRWRGK